MSGRPRGDEAIWRFPDLVVRQAHHEVLMGAATEGPMNVGTKEP
jgi:hypothetical protein